MNKVKLHYYFQLKLAKLYKKIRLNFKKPELKNFPTTIQLEPSIKCNAKCKMCPHHIISREEKLDLTKIKSIIDECIGKGVENIFPMNWNEPFLHSDIIEILRYIRKKLPNVKINIFTNCSVLTKEISDILIEEKLLDSIFFSFDTLDPIHYRKIRKLDYNTSLKNAKYFIKKNSKSRNPIKTSVSFTLLEENQDELKSFKRYWRNLVDNILVGVNDGRFSKPYIAGRETNLPCSKIFDSLVVLCNGDVVACCLDYNEDLIMGNVYENSIQETWNSEKFRRLRKAHINGNRCKIRLCKECPVV